MIWVLLLFCFFFLIYFGWAGIFFCCVWAFSSCSEPEHLYTCSVVASLVAEQVGSRARGLSSCGVRVVALQHGESSWTRDWTHAPCIGRQILNLCTTREVLQIILDRTKSSRTILVWADALWAFWIGLKVLQETGHIVQSLFIFLVGLSSRE